MISQTLSYHSVLTKGDELLNSVRVLIQTKILIGKHHHLVKERRLSNPNKQEG